MTHVLLFRVAHRDIKPTNFLVDGAGKCVISDFDLSMILDSFDDNQVLRQVSNVVLFLICLTKY